MSLLGSDVFMHSSLTLSQISCRQALHPHQPFSAHSYMSYNYIILLILKSSVFLSFQEPKIRKIVRKKFKILIKKARFDVSLAENVDKTRQRRKENSRDATTTSAHFRLWKRLYHSCIGLCSHRRPWRSPPCSKFKSSLQRQMVACYQHYTVLSLRFQVAG